MAAHVLGFMNEISAEELRTKKDEGYRPGDLIGRTGIERQWDGYLRGHAGFHKVVVDRRGLPKTDIRDVIEGPSTKAAVPGNNVVLTLDAEAAEDRGARAAPGGGGGRGRDGRRRPGACWRWCRSRPSIPTRCRAT